MKWSIQVITLAVDDVERAKAFYVHALGFALDVDYKASDAFRVVQLTPPGSGCSIQFGTGLTAPASSTRGLTLVVDDIVAAREALLATNVPAGPLRSKHDAASWQGDFSEGVDPGRGDYASFFDFSDPDGNEWTVQEIGHRAFV